MSLVKFRNRAAQPSVFDTFFDDFINRDLLRNNGFGMKASTPKANIREEEDNYTIELAAPGFNKDEFNVEVEENRLVLSVERSDEQENEEENFKHREFQYQSFTRSFLLPEDVDEEKIDAKYNDGILRVKLPKDENQKAKLKKRIDVK